MSITIPSPVRQRVVMVDVLLISRLHGILRMALLVFMQYIRGLEVLLRSSCEAESGVLSS